MKILYVSYWGVDEGLTHATVFPSLEILSSFEAVNEIVFCSVERHSKEVRYTGPISKKISFHPLRSKNIRPALLNKVLDFKIFPQQLKQLCKTHAFDYILARSAPAGSLVWKISKQLGIPLVIESFEPHADYMLESGVWSRNNPKYLFEKKWERLQKQHASALITVSNNYQRQLIAEGISPEKIHTIPCFVALDKFDVAQEQRQLKRQQLGISPTQIVGVYVGKFGDIYYKEEAFQLIADAFAHFGSDFYFLILSPQPKSELLAGLAAYSIPLEKVLIDCVPHEEIPTYLAAADIAFSFVKPAECRKFCSPIKDGEYWATGLPIIMGEGIGDDSDIIQQHPSGGAIFNADFSNLESVFSHLQTLISEEQVAATHSKNKALAHQYRSKDSAFEVYRKVLNI